MKFFVYGVKDCVTNSTFIRIGESMKRIKKKDRISISTEPHRIEFLSN